MITRALALAVVLSVPLTASATCPRYDESDTPLLSYDGTLVVNGTGITGEVDIRFTLYQDDAPVWVETWASDGDGPAVDVREGRFSAMLGCQVSLDGVVQTQGDLELGMEVRGASDAWTALSGREEITSAMGAASAGGTDGNLLVGTMEIIGQLNTSSSDVNIGTLNTPEVETNTLRLPIIVDTDVSGFGLSNTSRESFRSRDYPLDTGGIGDIWRHGEYICVNLTSRLACLEIFD